MLISTSLCAATFVSLFPSSVPSPFFYYSFVFFLSIDERRKCGSILSYTAIQCTPSYANESHSFIPSFHSFSSPRSFFHDPLHFFFFLTRFEISSPLFYPFLFFSSSWSHVRRSSRIRDRLVKRNVREVGGS